MNALVKCIEIGMESGLDWPDMSPPDEWNNLNITN